MPKSASQAVQPLDLTRADFCEINKPLRFWSSWARRQQQAVDGGELYPPVLYQGKKCHAGWQERQLQSIPRRNSQAALDNVMVAMTAIGQRSATS
jgi:hypothetical protein